MNEVVCPQCGEVLDAEGVEAFTVCECPKCATQLLIPEKFGNLLLQQKINQTARFNIYSGIDPEKNIPLIIFVLDNTLPDHESFLEIAREEFAKLQNLKQNNINPILYSSPADTEPFFIAEPVPNGCSAAEYICNNPQPLDIGNVTEIIKSAALGLATAHHREIIHHDISADNIHIDSNGNVKITNFFISRYIYRMNQVAHSGMNVSPYFISPEKAEHGAEDRKGDVFSMGVLFYCMLTGQYPFNGNDESEIIRSRIKKFQTQRFALPRQTAPDQPAAAAHTQETSHYVAPHPPHKLRPEIPEQINELIIQSLSSYPASRPTIPQFLDAISAYQVSLDKEQNISAAQRKMILSKTIPLRRTEAVKGIASLFKF